MALKKQMLQKAVQYVTMRIMQFQIFKKRIGFNQPRPKVGVITQVLPGQLYDIYIINDIIKEVMDRILRGASHLNKIDRKVIMTARNIQSAIKMELPGNLVRGAVNFGTKAVCMSYQSTAL